MILFSSSVTVSRTRKGVAAIGSGWSCQRPWQPPCGSLLMAASSKQLPCGSLLVVASLWQPPYGSFVLVAASKGQTLNVFISILQYIHTAIYIYIYITITVSVFGWARLGGGWARSILDWPILIYNTVNHIKTLLISKPH